MGANRKAMVPTKARTPNPTEVRAAFVSGGGTSAICHERTH